ncbi:phage tail protein [Gibbsiella quercinecans]|uniref:phage tail protein n=1 Tax=Gibbsiella quercinecans TaxID=929813 RepID=UPI003A4E42C3
MIKPDSLRDALADAVPYVAQNPDCLHMFVDKGAIYATLAPSLSFEYQYTLNLIITGYADSADLLIVPILHWLRTYQPDIMANPDRREHGFTFEADFLNNALRDISIDLKLTERVIVKEENSTLQVNHVDEPAPPPTDIARFELWMKGRKVIEWEK